MINPIPNSAANIRRAYSGSKSTNTLIESKTYITGQAVSIERIPSVAIITDRCTLSTFVEKGSVSTLNADGLISSFTKDIRNSSETGVSNTLTLNQVKCLIASDASSSG